MRQSMRGLTVLIVASVSPQISTADFKDVPHPFILWTKDEAAAIRKRVETEPWAKSEYERLLKEEGGLGRTFRNLFEYAAMGDRKAGEAERDYLLKIIGTHPSQYENLDQDGQLADEGTARLIACMDAVVAQTLVNDRRLRKLCQLAGERSLVFRVADEAAVRKGLRELGYVLPPPR